LKLLRVQMDIAAQGQKIIVLIHYDRLVSPLEQMPPSIVLVVNVNRITCIDVMHNGLNVGHRGLNSFISTTGDVVKGIRITYA